MPNPQPIKLPFPVKGLDANRARADQPPLTSPDLLNVMPYDAGDRARGGIRPGTTRMWPTGPVDDMGDPVVTTDGELASPLPGSCSIVIVYSLAFAGYTDQAGQAWDTGGVWQAGELGENLPGVIRNGSGDYCTFSGSVGGGWTATLVLDPGVRWLLSLFNPANGTLTYEKLAGTSPAGVYTVIGTNPMASQTLTIG